jgi:arginase family enzyme
MRGLEGINLIAADIVEVAPAYDTNAELTTMAAAVSIPIKIVGTMLMIFLGRPIRGYDLDGHERTS